MKNISLLLMTASVLSFSCSKHEQNQSFTGYVKFSFEEDMTRQCTKSDDLSTGLMEVKSWTAGAYRDGKLTETFTGAGASGNRITLKEGTYNLHFLLNFSDGTFFPEEEAELSDATFSFGRTDFGDAGLPATASVFGVEAGTDLGIVNATLLACKIRFRIADSNIEGLSIRGISLRQTSLDCRPFARVDYISMEHTSEMTGGTIKEENGWYVFYALENLQGSVTNSEAKDKRPEYDGGKIPDDKASRCTYLQVDAHVGGSESCMLDGNVRYRMYLGADNTGDLNLRRNNCYDIVLHLDTDRLHEAYLEPYWKVITSEFSVAEFQCYWESSSNNGSMNCLATYFTSDGTGGYRSYWDYDIFSDEWEGCDFFCAPIWQESEGDRVRFNLVRWDNDYSHKIISQDMYYRQGNDNDLLGERYYDLDEFKVKISFDGNGPSIGAMVLPKPAWDKNSAHYGITCTLLNDSYISSEGTINYSDGLTVDFDRDISDLYVGEILTAYISDDTGIYKEFSVEGNGNYDIIMENEKTVRLKLKKAGQDVGFILKAKKGENPANSTVCRSKFDIHNPRVVVNGCTDIDLALCADGTSLPVEISLLRLSGESYTTYDDELYEAYLAPEFVWSEDADCMEYITMEEGRMYVSSLTDIYGNCFDKLRGHSAARVKLRSTDENSAKVKVSIIKPFSSEGVSAGILGYEGLLSGNDREIINKEMLCRCLTVNMTNGDSLNFRELTSWSAGTDADGHLAGIIATYDKVMNSLTHTGGKEQIQYRIQNIRSGETYDSPALSFTIALKAALALMAHKEQEKWYMCPVWINNLSCTDSKVVQYLPKTVRYNDFEDQVRGGRFKPEQYMLEDYFDTGVHIAAGYPIEISTFVTKEAFYTESQMDAVLVDGALTGNVFPASQINLAFAAYWPQWPEYIGAGTDGDEYWDSSSTGDDSVHILVYDRMMKYY